MIFIWATDWTQHSVNGNPLQSVCSFTDKCESFESMYDKIPAQEFSMCSSILWKGTCFLITRFACITMSMPACRFLLHFALQHNGNGNKLLYYIRYVVHLLGYRHIIPWLNILNRSQYRIFLNSSNIGMYVVVNKETGILYVPLGAIFILRCLVRRICETVKSLSSCFTRSASLRQYTADTTANNILAQFICCSVSYPLDYSMGHDDVIKWKHFPHYWSWCGEFTGHWWIPLTKVNGTELWCFCDLHLNKRLNKQARR